MRSMKKINFSLGILLFLVIIAIFGYQYFGTESSIALKYYYDYDAELPLEIELEKIKTTTYSELFHLEYRSVNEQRVTALYSLPLHFTPPYPAIIYLHGIGDSKSVDYLQLGDSLFCQAGFAVLRIDIQYHGERKKTGMDVHLTKNYPYASRNALVQTIFDLHRALDFLEGQSEIDSSKTGFLGISLGGILGTIFIATEPRIEVPIIALAGGGLKFLFGAQAIKPKLRNFLAPIEPLNFAQQISGKPLLFLNAEHDEVVPKTTSLALHRKTGKPQTVIWYDSGHIIPAQKALPDCRDWFLKYF